LNSIASILHMSAVVIANRSEAELAHIVPVLAARHEIFEAGSVGALAGMLERCDLLILDANFTDAHGIDVLMEVASTRYLPILMVVPPDDPKCAVEAVRCGAFNYVIKIGDYGNLLAHAVEDALSRFNEREEMLRMILALKAQVAELEQGTRVPMPAAAASGAATPPAQQPRRDVLPEIMALLRQGEINLPVFPSAGADLRRMVDDQAPVAAIARLLEQDVAIATKLISVSNSAYYRGAKDNHTLAQAIERLGLGETRNIVELLANRALYAIRMPAMRAFLPSLWTHAVACAHAAQLTARQLQLPNADAVFTMGLLHDIGELILLQILAEMQLRGSLEAMAPMAAMELARAHHCRFGSAILKRWKLPDAIVEVALLHENLSEAEAITKDLLVVNFADTLVKSMGYGAAEPAPVAPHETESARLLKLQPAAIGAIEAELRKVMAGSDFSLEAA
jgi:HD-like signal output (HDOD) protein/AmiR/NasT family two-component response regulator